MPRAFLRRVLRLLPLPLLVLIVMIGAVSHFRFGLIGWSGATHTFFARSAYGQVSIWHHRTDATTPRGSLLSWQPLDPDWTMPSWPGWWRKLGFGYEVGGTAGGNVAR